MGEFFSPNISKRTSLGFIEDYFLIFHGICYESKNCFIDLKNDSDDFLEISTIFLSVNRNNYSKFIKVPSFVNLVKKYFQNKIGTLEDIYEYQYNILSLLKPAKKDIGYIKQYIKFLREKEVITYQEYNKLENILDIVKLSIKEEPTSLQINLNNDKNIQQNNKKSYLESKSKITSIISQLREIGIDRVDKIETKLKNKKFSIGVTGIINSGKSTMLNAILEKDILGTSIIPETANLTVLKYSNTPKANVIFWNKKEWDDIEKLSINSEPVKKFIHTTKETFSQNLDKYIREKNYILSINISEIKKYTSASDPSKLCNLVKAIDLYSDLKYLKDGVEIVDTPGLDDPITTREEITKSYLLECDTLIHLMNANQSSSSKDIDFIINSIVYHNVSKLIIVLTKVDTVTKEELEEVLAYTKSSIKSSLQMINKENRLDFVLSKIEFIPTNAKDKNDTGVKRVKEILNEMLFGKDNQKNTLFTNSILMQISDLIDDEISRTKLSISLLSKSKYEVEKLHKKFLEDKSNNQKFIEAVSKEIENEKNILLMQISNIENSISSQLENLSSLISNRISDDIKYELKSGSFNPDKNRIKYIFITGKRDGLIDIFRDNSYAIKKQLENSKNILKLKFKELEVTFDQEDIEDSYSGNFIDKVVLTDDDEVLKKIDTAIQKVKKDKFDKFQIEISQIIKEYFKDMEKTVLDIFKTIKKKNIQRFDSDFKKPLERIKEKFSNEEQLFLDILNKGNEDKKIKEKNIQKINEKLKKLEKLKRESC